MDQPMMERVDPLLGASLAQVPWELNDGRSTVSALVPASGLCAFDALVSRGQRSRAGAGRGEESAVSVWRTQCGGNGMRWICCSEKER
jgi:hypothetical protein